MASDGPFLVRFKQIHHLQIVYSPNDTQNPDPFVLKNGSWTWVHKKCNGMLYMTSDLFIRDLFIHLHKCQSNRLSIAKVAPWCPPITVLKGILGHFKYRRIIWSSDQKGMCMDGRKRSLQPVWDYGENKFDTSIEGNLSVLWIELMVPPAKTTWNNNHPIFLWHYLVFQDMRFCQIKKNCQKLPPVGIERRDSWSSL